MSEKRILLTAFEPFGGETVNPTMEILDAVRAPQGVSLSRLVVPVVYGEAFHTVLTALREAEFDAVLMLGQAGGRKAVTVERIAVNLADASIPDNAGAQPVEAPLVPDGPDGIFATIPVRKIVEAIRAGGVDAAPSNSAGTFVCNSLMYRTLYHLRGSSTRAGFIHVPYLPVQTGSRPGVPSMSLENMVRAVEIALETL